MFQIITFECDSNKNDNNNKKIKNKGVKKIYERITSIPSVSLDRPWKGGHIFSSSTLIALSEGAETTGYIMEYYPQ